MDNRRGPTFDGCRILLILDIYSRKSEWCLRRKISLTSGQDNHPGQSGIASAASRDNHPTQVRINHHRPEKSPSVARHEKQVLINRRHITIRMPAENLSRRNHQRLLNFGRFPDSFARTICGITIANRHIVF